MSREEIVVAGDEENIIGALTSMLQARPPTGAPTGWRGAMQNIQRTVGAPRFSATNIANQVGGAGRDNKLRAPLGLGSKVFTDNTPFAFVVEPQEAFRGERLIVDGSGDAGLLLSIDLIMVGSLPQMPSTEFGLPASMFRPDATDAQMDWQICPAGTKIIVKAHVEGTFGEGDTFTAQLGIYGEWIRG